MRIEILLNSSLSLILMTLCSPVQSDASGIVLNSLPKHMYSANKIKPENRKKYANKQYVVISDCMCSGRKFEILNSEHLKISSICTAFNIDDETGVQRLKIRKILKTDDVVTISTLDTSKSHIGKTKTIRFEFSPDGTMTSNIKLDNLTENHADFIHTSKTWFIDIKRNDLFIKSDEDCGNFDG